MPEIIKEILHSDKWHAVVTNDDCGLKRVVIKALYHDSKTFVEIWEKEIHIKATQSNHTYRIFRKGSTVICEYFGTHHELLRQHLLPKITPAYELKPMPKEKTANYQENKQVKEDKQSLPNRFMDEFIKNDMPVPHFNNNMN